MEHAINHINAVLLNNLDSFSFDDKRNCSHKWIPTYAPTNAKPKLIATNSP